MLSMFIIIILSDWFYCFPFYFLLYNFSRDLRTGYVSTFQKDSLKGGKMNWINWSNLNKGIKRVFDTI